MAASAGSPPASWRAWRRCRIPAHGYGIRYDHGLFRQVIQDGWQQEYPEDWLAFGNPWEFARPEVQLSRSASAASVETRSRRGRRRRATSGTRRETVDAVAYDTPIVGWRGRHVNTLRLWSARAADPLRLDAFNRGDHVGALAERARGRMRSRRCSIPSDATPAGQELRLRQEYFFASASLQDLVAPPHAQQHGDIRTLADKAAIQLNDTHPAIAVAELMRLLVDLHELPWDEAWQITTATFSYTNHTLLPEALESWPVPLMERLLPRHMQIIYLINARASRRGCALPSAVDGPPLAARLADRRARRAAGAHGHLAFLGSHKVNGVSALHTELMRETVFRDLHRLYPGPHRQQDQRHHLPPLADRGQSRPDRAAASTSSATRVLDDADALDELRRVRRRYGAAGALRRDPPRQQGGAGRADRATGSASRVDPDALFDVQIKRIHEYKRQLLNILETIALLQRDPRAADARLGAAGEDLRRQGGGQLSPRQADHQADQRRRAT